MNALAPAYEAAAVLQIADDDMAWAEPSHTLEAVNAAGKALVAFYVDDAAEYTPQQWARFEAHLAVINNWKQSHNYPLNTFQKNLRETSERFDSYSLTSQRIKRLASIGAKLARSPRMKLTQMQDIGGCRTVVSSVRDVRRIVDFYQSTSRIKHLPGPVDDYISNPKESGYRGIHLVYRYVSDKNKTIYNGLKVEMQIRSRFQHAWATAVETVGLFTGHALKSSMGDKEWLRFFSLMGSVIALREETKPIPNTPRRKKDLIKQVSTLAEKLSIIERLNGYADALQYIENDVQDAHWYLLQLDPSNNALNISGFKKSQIAEAEKAYAIAELDVRRNPGRDAVLVAVDSVSELPRAYPNYYADTTVFLQLLAQARSGKPKNVAPSKLRAVQQLSLQL